MVLDLYTRSTVINHRDDNKIIYWHRELPPIDAKSIVEHTIEASSGREPGTIGHRDDLWDRCDQELMAIRRRG
jgi:hypothetical protein